jgi:error-prone DNA polymerase
LAATGFELAPLVANRLTDLPADLAAIGVRRRFPLPHGRRDEFHHDSTRTQLAGEGSKLRDIYVPAHRRHRGEDAAYR